MAIAPNTTFVSGAVLTAAQQNAFGFGVVAYTSQLVSDVTVTAEEVQITGGSFTAIANRYYKVTYFEPWVVSQTATSFVSFRIRLTNLAGATQQQAYNMLPTSGVTNLSQTTIWIGTLSAGATNFVATGQSNTGTANFNRSATNIAFLLVEDIGPA